ncbi:hypothetical protein CR513_01303, partial [Mucuna pruriens]
MNQKPIPEFSNRLEPPHYCFSPNHSQLAVHTQEEQTESKSRSGRCLINVHSKISHSWNTTNFVEKMQRSWNFLSPMHHWRLYLRQCYARLRSLNQCHASISL